MDEQNDLFAALGLFLMCFGQGLPAELKRSINARVHAVADIEARNGNANVAKLSKGLADALLGPQPMH